MAELARTIDLLAELIEHRTDNPGGDELGLCERLAGELRGRGADEVEVTALARPGSARGGYLYARWGAPRLLINAHLDTVPANSGWTVDPFRATRAGDRLIGLGAADTKGATACLLAALDGEPPRDLAVLLSGDEEKTGTCVRHFLASPRARGLERAIVCEPTARAAGVRHRGVLSYRAEVRGRGGHSSRADHMPKPIVTLARLAVELDRLEGPADMKGLCMNVASLEGGVAFNVVPDRAALLWSLRPPPGFDAETYEAEQQSCIAHAGAGIALEQRLHNAPFACRDGDGFAALLGGAVDRLAPLDFWTEAAVLSAAGIDCVVVGPGDIAQAHAADEFVSHADLEWGVALFSRIIAESRGS
jgi:acetylornithine deacetylase